jgi:hypothetical protein
MPEQFPSDRLNLPNLGDLTVGEARDFIDRQTALFRPFKLLKVARGLSNLLHQEKDFTMEGYVTRLPQEFERLAQRGEQFAAEVLARRSASP